MPEPQVGRLLVVEDAANDPDGWSHKLAGRGYRVDVAGDGAGALEKIRQAEYDLVLLDVSLLTPQTSSLDLLRLLRASHSPAELPVILLSEQDRNSIVVEALRGGANDYIVKPVDLPVMTARIEEQLSRSRIVRQRRLARSRRHSEGRWMWNLGSNTIHFSARSRALLGLGREEIGSHPEEWAARIHPGDVDRVRAELRTLRDGKTSNYRSEYRARNRRGRYEWRLAHAWTERSEDGAVTRVCGTLAAKSRPDVDALTGLGTRAWILERLGAAVASNGTLALMLLDLDGFGLMNDSFGQSTGDRILTEVAARLQSTLVDAEPSDSGHLARIVARIGDDEFAILAEGVASGELGALVELILHARRPPDDRRRFQDFGGRQHWSILRASPGSGAR